MHTGTRLVGIRKQKLIDKVDAILKKLQNLGVNTHYLQRKYLTKSFYTTKELPGVISDFKRLLLNHIGGEYAPIRIPLTNNQRHKTIKKMRRG